MSASRGLLVACAVLAAAGAPATAQASGPALAPVAADTLADRFAVFTGGGQPSSLDAIADAVRPGDVLFLGEQHDDRTGHALELRILQAVAARHPVVLALEMFETDVQTVLSEYTFGTIDERSFLADARPWSNYAADYRPLVEFVKDREPFVVASNAPARYVRLVTRDGMDALDRLAPPPGPQFVPRHIDPPSDSLAAQFLRLMGGMGGHGGGPTPEAMLVGQNLRDATMAWSIVTALTARREAVVVHVNGSFHSAGHLGIPEHLARIMPEARAVVVTMQPSATLAAPASSADDFVIVTAVP